MEISESKEMKIMIEVDVGVRKKYIFDEMQEFSYRIASLIEKMLRERSFRIWDIQVHFLTPEHSYRISPLPEKKLDDYCNEKE